jgi:hypothetical protein
MSYDQPWGVPYQLFGVATVTATAPNVSGTINTAVYREGSLHVVVSGKAGSTSKLRPVWQSSHDGINFADHSAMATFSNATGTRVLNLNILSAYGRCRYTVSGTGAAVKMQMAFVGK